MDSTTSGDHKGPQQSYRALWWLAAFGLTLRAYHYGRNPSMWHDEAGSVLNVLKKSFSELLGPLYASSTGPPLFLWLQKCVVLVLGDGTYALRLVSFVASCGGLILVAAVARRTLSLVAAAAAVLLVACSDRLLWHAAEARHYSTDFLIAAGLLAMLVGTQAWSAGRRALLFGALVPVVIFASYPGVFLCGGVFVALLPALLREGRLRGWLAAIGLSAIIAVSFIALFFVNVRAQRTAALDAYWATTFPDWTAPWTVPLWFMKSTIAMVDYMTRPIGGILIIPALLGAVQCWRKGRKEIVTFAAVSVLLAVIAALFKAYPYTGTRTMVFAMPAIAVLIGAGVGSAIAWMGRFPARRAIVIAIVAAPLLATLLLSLYRTGVTWPRADAAGASAYVLQHRQNGEPVTANHYEYEYYFRGLGGTFYEDLRLLHAQDLPARYWIVVTSGDPLFPTHVVESIRGSRILDRQEFARTTVFHMSHVPDETSASHKH